MQIQVLVKPNARGSVLTVPEAGQTVYHARLQAPPQEGRANAELIRLLAEHFGVRKSAITILSGHTSRLKRVEIAVG